MADPASIDPFALWRDFTSQLEKRANELANQATESDQFTGVMNKAMSASLVAKKTANEMTNRYLSAMNLPSRADIDALGERLRMIEERLIGMSAVLDRLAGPKVAGAAGLPTIGPSRTRKPPPETLAAPPAVAAAATAAVTAAAKAAVAPGTAAVRPAATAAGKPEPVPAASRRKPKPPTARRTKPTSASKTNKARR